MAKAHITTKDGSTILIEGTAEEVAALLARFKEPGSSSERNSGDVTSRSPNARKSTSKANGKVASKKKVSATTLVAEMLLDGGFKVPRGLGEIQAQLRQWGHYYSNPAIATALLRAVKKRELRRIRRDNAWTYVV